MAAMELSSSETSHSCLSWLFAAWRSLLGATIRSNVREKVHCANCICQCLRSWFNYWTCLYSKTNKQLTKRSMEECIKNLFTANMPFSLPLKCTCLDLLISSCYAMFSWLSDEAFLFMLLGLDPMQECDYAKSLIRKAEIHLNLKEQKHESLQLQAQSCQVALWSLA